MKHVQRPPTGKNGLFIPILQAIACTTLLLAGTAQAADATLDKARQLLDDNQGPAAYKLLADELEQRAGEPDYDYLLALAALEAGEPAVAVFALERVLAVRPDHGPALVALGRAHYLMGEDDAARRSLQQAARQRLGTADQAAVKRYLNAIERRTTGVRQRLTGYIELGAGYDGNVNSAPNDSTVDIFGMTLLLDDAITNQSDGFLRLRGGADYTGPLTTATRLLFGARADLRRHDEHDAYDSDAVDAYFGLRWLQGRNRYSAVMQAQQFYVDESLYRELGGLTLQWDRFLDARNQLTFFAQGSAIRYPYQETRDVDQYSGGMTWGHAFDAAGKPLFYLGAYGGADREKEDTYFVYDQKFWGARAGIDFSLGQSLGLSSSLHWHEGRYDSEDPLLLTRRHDQRIDAIVSLNYRVTHALSVRPQVRYTHNDSTIDIYDFERGQAQLALRYDFH